jgi:hypothetical protein
MTGSQLFSQENRNTRIAFFIFQGQRVGGLHLVSPIHRTLERGSRGVGAFHGMSTASRSGNPLMSTVAGATAKMRSMDAGGPWIRHVTKPARVCFCNEGWICEAHRDLGWPHDDCAGPGMPCPRCNADDPPRMPTAGRHATEFRERVKDAGLDVDSCCDVCLCRGLHYGGPAVAHRVFRPPADSARWASAVHRFAQDRWSDDWFCQQGTYAVHPTVNRTPGRGRRRAVYCGVGQAVRCAVRSVALHR